MAWIKRYRLLREDQGSTRGCDERDATVRLGVLLFECGGLATILGGARL